jgi:cbb3-type cytochrome oxidase subunit 3
VPASDAVSTASNQAIESEAAHGSLSANQSNGLSTGAALGIGIAGAVFLIMILCVLGWFLYRRARRNRNNGGAAIFHAHERNETYEAKAEPRKNRRSKADGNSVKSPYELSGRSRASELETNANRHELDGHRRAERRHELPSDESSRSGTRHDMCFKGSLQT